ncbi:MAG: PSD1 and planctomycete cytochrome C domain-containing protein [Verrucomicrobiota bacterium]
MNPRTLPLLLLPVIATAAFAAAENPARLEFFEKKVRPVLVDNCYNCHSAETKPAGGLRVDDRHGLLAGGDTGPAIVPGDPERSLLLRRVRHEDAKRRMPKEGRSLTDAEIADLATWIRDGAVWPAAIVPANLGKGLRDYASNRTNHWAWQPRTAPKVPAVKDATWPRNNIDRFLLAKLESKKLRPVADADPIQWLRRVTFDLTGLPPTPAEIAEFRRDASPNARAHWVDRLLASPRFGERWGRHWLDVARYGESTGPSRNIPFPHAWKYRDYVLDAVNRDVPFDRFIHEQVAGDLLPASTEAERDRLSIATGFLALGVKDVNQRFKTRFIMDNVAEQVDTVTRSFIGLTVGCARCHDHKFDPIPTTDYYALAGIFTSTEDCAGVRSKMGGGGLDYYDSKALVRLSSTQSPPPADQVAKLEAEVAEAKKAWDAIRGTPEGLKLAANGQPTQRPFRLKYERLQGELLALTDPAARGDAAHGVREGKAIGDTELRIRGETERLGPPVPRGFLTTFQVPDAPQIPTNSSGRLQLAHWITHPANPLTARVAVNRIWAQLFGQGLVTTTDNFGVKGDVPSHPELLDHLASEFIRDGWSVKRLIRAIVLSHAYALGTDAPPGLVALDPGNRLVWRHSPRRLEAEEIRDSMLASSGMLQLDPPKASPARELKMIEMRDNGPEARRIREVANRSRHRSVYLPLLRGVTPAALEPFDPVEQGLVTTRREATTVPTQALYLLNSSFVRNQAVALAERLLADAQPSDAHRIRQAYLLTLGRPPRHHEITRSRRFINDFAVAYGKEPTGAVPSPPIASVEAVVATDADKPAPVNPDDIDRTEQVPVEEAVPFRNARTAAWASFVQALYAAAEFRFIP